MLSSLSSLQSWPSVPRTTEEVTVSSSLLAARQRLRGLLHTVALADAVASWTAAGGHALRQREPSAVAEVSHGHHRAPPRGTQGGWGSGGGRMGTRQRRMGSAAAADGEVQEGAARGLDWPDLADRRTWMGAAANRRNGERR